MSSSCDPASCVRLPDLPIAMRLDEYLYERSVDAVITGEIEDSKQLWSRVFDQRSIKQALQQCHAHGKHHYLMMNLGAQVELCIAHVQDLIHRVSLINDQAIPSTASKNNTSAEQLSVPLHPHTSRTQSQVSRCCHSSSRVDRSHLSKLRKTASMLFAVLQKVETWLAYYGSETHVVHFVSRNQSGHTTGFSLRPRNNKFKESKCSLSNFA